MASQCSGERDTLGLTRSGGGLVVAPPARTERLTRPHETGTIEQCIRIECR